MAAQSARLRGVAGAAAFLLLAAAQERPAVSGVLPGAAPFPPELVKKLEAAWASRPAGYRPRSRHLHADGTPEYVNRLFLESSPYLLQHAHNPVDWYPWSDEAFEKAKELRRPVLLSVGYSTCHWCHVMEEESFEDEEIARVLNDGYVAVKVDREERPDVDAIYMSAVQSLTGSGGWPMTVWLTPDRRPFYGGTYFPPRDGERGVTAGFLTLLRKLKQLYDTDGDRVAAASAGIARAIQADLAPPGSGLLAGARTLDDVVKAYAARFDWQNGGTLRAPKFPSNLPIRVLLRHHLRTGDEKSLQMAALTLEKMAAGGIYDHVGGGFHRYSTDERWLVPHFEKMLYDNALLTVAFLEGYQATGRKDFAQVAREVLGYVTRDMTSPEGAFYSATDADSLAPSGQLEEGWFFTWTPAEIEAAVGRDRSRIVEAYFAVTPQGNFHGRSVLHAPTSIANVARELDLPAEKVRSALDESRELLHAARRKRRAPFRDEKILTAWNGLMISAFARAALVLGDGAYARQAARAAEVVVAKLEKDGRLSRSYKDGRARHEGVLSDYAFLAAGLLDLYEAGGDPRWLREAVALDRALEEHFEDEQTGGFFMTGDDHETLLAREKPAYDGAEPSGNSVAVMNLLRLAELTSDDGYRKRAERALGAFAGILERSPAALSEMLLALDFRLDTPKEVVIVTLRSRQEAEPFLAELRSTFLPNRVLAVGAEGADLAQQAKLVPLLEGKSARGGKPTAYVCERGVCRLPTDDPQVFARQIRKVKSPAD